MTDPTFFPSGSAYVNLAGRTQAKLFGVDDSVSPAQPGWVKISDLPAGTSGTNFNPRGAWAANTTYAADDVVSYQGSSYFAIAGFTSGSTFNASNWQLLASKGDPGSGSTSTTTYQPRIIDGTSGTAVASSGSPYQMLATDRVLEVNKSTGAATVVNWPSAPVLGELYTVIDGRGDAGTNNITVNFPPGVTGTVTGWKAGDGPVASVVLNANYDVITVRFTANVTTARVV